MKTIDQLIFDELVSRGSASLEGVGTLTVKTAPARMDNGKISAPHKTVAFDSSFAGESVSVMKLLEKGTTSDKAKELYDTWLTKAKEGDSLSISGVGKLNGSDFTVAPELEKALNPASAEEVAAKPRRRGLLWIIIAIILLLLLLGLYMCNRKGSGCGLFSCKQPEVVVVPLPEKPEPVAEPPKQPTEPAKPAVPEKGKYYVVAGVFDIPSNADNYVESLKKRFPGMDIQKLPFRDNRTMVTMFSSTDWNTALEQRRKLARENYDEMYEIWIYYGGK